MSVICRHCSLISFFGIGFYIFTFGFSFSVDYSLLALATTTAFLTLIDAREQNFKFFNLYIVCFLASIIASNFFGIDNSRSASFALVILPALLSYYLITNYLTRFYIYQLYILLSVFSLLVSVYLIAIAMYYPEENPSVWITKAQLTFLTVPNSIDFLVLLSPLSVALFKSEKNILKALAIISLFATFSLTIIYQSRSALLVMLILMLSISLFLTRLKVTLTILSILFCAVVLIDATSGYGLFAKIFFHNWTARLPLWLAAFYMFLDAPLIGNGSGSYLLLYRQSLDHHQALSLLNEDPRLTPWAHNLYLEVLAEQGLIGFLLLISMLGFYLTKAWKNFKQSSEDNLLILCVFIALIGFYLVALFELSLWQQWVLVLLFIFFAIIDRLSLIADPFELF